MPVERPIRTVMCYHSYSRFTSDRLYKQREFTAINKRHTYNKVHNSYLIRLRELPAGGGFFLVCKNFGWMFVKLFPACAFFFSFYF